MKTSVSSPILKPQMQPSESIEKAKKFFHKSLRDLKKIFFEGNKRLPKCHSCKPFSCGSIGTKSRQADRYYTDFCDDWQCDLDKAVKRKNNGNVAPEEQIREEAASNASSLRLVTSPVKKTGAEEKVKKNKRGSNSRKVEDSRPPEGGSPLARRMKELEMMDVSDLEHVLDVEEAVHYYSRLRSPVYLDIVDKFFMDMYTEFSVPQASAASISSSKRRLGSIKL